MYVALTTAKCDISTLYIEIVFHDFFPMPDIFLLCLWIWNLGFNNNTWIQQYNRIFIANIESFHILDSFLLFIVVDRTFH